MKKSYHLKTSTLYFLTAENPKELFGKLYPRRIEATEYRLMEMECEDYQEVIGEYDDDHNYWEIIDEVNEGVEFDGHWLAGFEAVSSMFELAGYEQVDIYEEGYEEFDDIEISKLEFEKIRIKFNKSKEIIENVNNQLLKDAVQEWLDNPASSEKKYGHISNWGTSEVTSMEELFSKAETFNHPLDNWDVSNVTNMNAMFAETKLFNQPLDKWDVSNVTDMSFMFSGTESFNQPLAKWDVSNVTKMGYMFAETTLFNQPLDKWDVSSVTNMMSMFADTESFNQSLNDWNTSNCTNMSRMFSGALSFNQPIGDWNVGNVYYMNDMFYKALAFNQDTSSWDTSSWDTNPYKPEVSASLDIIRIEEFIEKNTSAWLKMETGNYSALFKMEAGNYNEALKDVLESIDILSYSNNNDTAAMIYFHMQDFEKGLEYSNESIKMNETSSKHFYNRAQILVKLDKKDLAIKDLKKAIDLDGFEDAKKLLEQIT
jgi:surface protein